MLINIFAKFACCLKLQYLILFFVKSCLAGAVANVADPDRCRCNPKVPGSIPAGGKDFP